MEWKTRKICTALLPSLVTCSRLPVFTSLFIVQVILSSCHKDNVDVFVPSVDPADTIWVENSTAGAKQDFQKLLDTLSTVPTDILISNIQNSQAVTLGTDLILDIPANGFLDKSGKIARGDAKVSVLYLDSRGEILKNKISGKSNGQILKTAFVLKLAFFQDGSEIILAPNKKAEIFIGNKKPETGNQLFTNGPGMDRSNWINFTNGEIEPISHNSKKGYTLLLGQLPWLLAGQSVNADKTTKVTAMLPNIFTNANSKIYLLLNDRNGLSEMEQNKNARTFFADDIPVGSSITVISVSSVNNSYYLGSADLKVKNNDHVKVNPKLVSLAELNAYMNSLQ
jgi:hypothetical protein